MCAFVILHWPTYLLTYLRAWRQSVAVSDVDDKVAWFPRHISELDKSSNRVIELHDDHPVGNPAHYTNTQFTPPGQTRSTTQSCLRRVCLCGVNWILDNSAQSPTENLKSEHVNSNCPIQTDTPDTTQTEQSCRVWRAVWIGHNSSRLDWCKLETVQWYRYADPSRRSSILTLAQLLASFLRISSHLERAMDSVSTECIVLVAQVVYVLDHGITYWQTQLKASTTPAAIRRGNNTSIRNISSNHRCKKRFLRFLFFPRF